MKDLMILSQALPVIETNFEEVKQDLKEQLEQYKTFVVIESTLSACKESQKGLAGLRNKIDTYRKDIKKTMSEPIAAFEEKCKQLITLVEDAEKPLKEGIKVFDDKKREEKRQTALKIITETIENNCISEKYASQLTVLDKYTNLTTTPKDVREDVEQRAFILLGEQKKETELLELIQDSIDTVNKTIKKQLNISGYQILIDRGISTKEIIQRINSDAANIWEAENPKPVEVVEPVAEPITETYMWKAETPKVEAAAELVVTQIEEATKQILEPKKEETMWFVTMDITGTTSQFAALKQFMLSSQITYKATSQEVIE